ncbi:carbohydrate kinase family protein [Fodinibius sediminis]|uniref:Fructokinase n=1 Tax=Fodinibius sediminis TaxID=1214077 RepID=A0A521AV89_9BACT|nr:carbohydrate kinase [Fodinibius sediminis]SMO38714.1 fructokinase [Fodinibius sediminis]
MNADFQTPKVYCFGEILWDILSEYEEYPGGAPLNVAYHLTKLTIPAGIISKIGTDPLGEQLKIVIDNWGVKSILQSDPVNSTGQVWAHIDENDEVAYKIVYPAAWDFIELDKDMINEIKAADYFIYGSLSARNSVSRNTLFELLNYAKYKVLDLNLRSPFYENELLEKLLAKADLLKINQSELKFLQKMLDGRYNSEREQISFVQKVFNIQNIVVTKGGMGASYYTQGNSYHTDGISVNVSDTIGCGDSFLASVVADHYFKRKPEDILKRATAMGAFIASKNGGCPTYEISDYIKFLKDN